MPQLEAVLHPLATEILDAGREPTIAEALRLQFAADRKAVWLDPAAQDVLDLVAWEADGSLLAAAFALARGRSLRGGDGVGRASPVSAPAGGSGLRSGGDGRFLASLGVGLDAHDRCLEAARPSGGGSDGVPGELAAALSQRRLRPGGARRGWRTGWAACCRGGSAAGSDRVRATGRAARKLCPPEWPEANHYALVASKAVGTLLCAYVDGRVTVEPLAWLLLSPELSPAP